MNLKKMNITQGRHQCTKWYDGWSMEVQNNTNK